MKKVTFLALLVLLLGGCSLKKSNSMLSSNRGSIQTESIETETLQSNSNSSNQENIDSFEEEEKLASIFDPNNFQVTKLVDNSEKRVLLFSNDNQKFYKSIFLKSTQFLKVVDLKNNEQEIFYGSI